MMKGKGVAPLCLLQLRSARNARDHLASVATKSAAATKVGLGKMFPSPTSLSPVVLTRREPLDQKPALGSQGGTVYGSEANAPTSGARTQSLALAEAVVVARRAATSLPAAMA